MKPHYKLIYENSIKELFKVYGSNDIEFDIFKELLHQVCENYRKEKTKHGST